MPARPLGDRGRHDPRTSPDRPHAGARSTESVTTRGAVAAATTGAASYRPSGTTTRGAPGTGVAARQPQTTARHGQRPTGPAPDRVRQPPGQAAGVVDEPSRQPVRRAPPRHELRPEPGPGSAGERLLQCAYGTQDRAQPLLPRPGPRPPQPGDDRVRRPAGDGVRRHRGRRRRVRRDACAPARPASCTCSTSGALAYPEYRGNGVLASLGNISENPHVGMLMVDFSEDVIGLHVNGRARIVEDADLRAEWPGLPAEFVRGRTPERWVRRARRGGLHPLPQAHPADAGRAAQPRLGHRRRAAQGRRLLRRSRRPGARAFAEPSTRDHPGGGGAPVRGRAGCTAACG